MKIIDLLNKIAKGEEVPKTITYMGSVYDYDNECKDYEDIMTGDLFFDDRYNTHVLNDEVAIVLEEVEDKEYEDIEEIKLVDTQNLWDRDIVIGDKLNALIRNQKYILEQLKNK